MPRQWKLFLLTRSPVSDSDASGWVVGPTAPSGHVCSVVCLVVPAESPGMVFPSNVYWKPSSKILGWPSCRPAPSQFAAGVPKPLSGPCLQGPCLTPVSSLVWFLLELLLLPHYFKTWLRGHHLREVFLDSAPCQDPPSFFFCNVLNLN